MALDAVHVLGNHDRYLIDRPPEKMGSWDRPAARAARREASRLAAHGAGRRACFAIRFFSATRRRRSDEVYWLETVLPDGTVRDVVAGGDRASRRRDCAAADSLRPHPHRARGPACRRTPGRQSRQRRRRPAIATSIRFRMSSRPARRMRATRSWNWARRQLARDLPACALRSRGDGGIGAPQRPA